MQATSTPKLVAQPPAALVALAAILFAAGIALGAAMDLDLRIPSTAPVAAPDTSYNAVEGARAQFGVAPDTSYDAVEGIRAQSGVTVDTSYDAIEKARALSGVTVDADAIQKAAAAKARAMSSVPAFNGGYDLTPRGAHGQLP